MKESHDKYISILAYIPIIGWIIALVLNSDKSGAEKSYNAFHLRQGLGLMMIELFYSLVNGIVLWLPIIGEPINRIINFGFVIFVLIGIWNAFQLLRKPLPFFGEKINSVLRAAFE